MLLMIDNYDSFTWNLVQYLQTLGAEVKVVRNDELSVAQIQALAPERIVISPGPCTPNEAGVSVDVIRKLGAHVPVLGVCLGHQSLGQAYGGDVVRAPSPVHGKTSRVSHKSRGLFRGLNGPFAATRYHSLVIKRETAPPALEIAAESDDGLIMAVSHRDQPVHGVQFHPESIASENGKKILENFLDIARAFNKTKAA